MEESRLRELGGERFPGTPRESFCLASHEGALAWGSWAASRKTQPQKREYEKAKLRRRLLALLRPHSPANPNTVAG